MGVTRLNGATLENDPFARVRDQAPRGLDAVMEDPEEQARYETILGPLFGPLADPTTTALRVMADGRIVQTRYGYPKRVLAETMEEHRRRTLIYYMANFEHGRAMDRLHSRLQCDLPIFGSRVQAFAPPISDWTLVFRNHAASVIPFNTYFSDEPHVRTSDTWADHPHRVRKGWAEAIVEAITLHKNIPIGGSVDSGKTTFLNSTLAKHAEIYPDERMVVVQDRREVRCDGFVDTIELLARVEQAHHEANGSVVRYVYEFADALEDAMRCDGDSITWGEVRDSRSAVGLVMAMNTGSRGCKFTTHANSAEDVPQRLEDFHTLIDHKPVKRMIARACELIVFLERDNATMRRRIVDVVRVLDATEDGYRFERVAP